MRIKQVFKHYTQCEEYESAMWKNSIAMDKELKIQQAVNFMSDTDAFEAGMRVVINEWPVSCEVNFTNQSINKVAWLGQASCANTIDCPEDLTKAAWSLLSDYDREKANNAAAKIIKKWTENYLDKMYA